MKKKIGIIGQFAPPMHGVAKALDTLCNSYLSDKYELYNIDIKSNKKILKTLIWLMISNFDLYYITISQSKLGNIRDLIIISLLKLKRKKVLIHFHGGGFRTLLDKEMCTIHRKINIWILKKIDGVIVLGKSLRYLFEGIVNEKKIYVVKNCIDSQMLISDKEIEKKLADFKKKDILNIVYLSNFIKNKGYQEVLKLAKLCEDRKKGKFIFTFAGGFLEDGSKEYLFKFISENALENSINYKGIVNGTEKRMLLKDGDIFILPLQNKKEGQPISIIEAMGNGLIIMTTDLIGISDIVSNKTSFKYNSDNINIENMYNDLLDIDSNREKYIEYINLNRDRVKKNFDEEKYINNIDEIFHEIIFH